jgi:hypothetical protein
MKRSNHNTKKGEPPAIICKWCRMQLRSKYEAKNHVCRGG